MAGDGGEWSGCGGGGCECVPWEAGQPLPWSNCDVDMKQIVEIDTWERVGHTPDTSQPPDTHTIEEQDCPPWLGPAELCIETCLSERVCPPGFFKLILEPEPLPDSSTCSVVWEHWYSVDPEIPHVKTYYAKETKTTVVKKAAKVAYTCVDAGRVQALLDGLKHVPV
jgi:hypothetical protein